METFCSRCKTPMSCEPEKACWCAELPNILPLPDDETEGCLCHDCLTEQLALQSTPPAHLSLWKKRLGRVPEWVWKRTEIETLVLADNELSEVPGQIGHLKNLRMLDLGHRMLWATSTS